MAIMEESRANKKRGTVAMLIALPGFWLFLFFLAPFALIALISISSPRIGMPPYEPLLQFGEDWWPQIHLNLGNFARIFTDNIYLRAAIASVKIAAISTILTLTIAYPLAYGIAACKQRWRSFLMFLVIIPFWSSMLIRIYAWIILLRTDGLINKFLRWLGIIDTPLRLLYTETAVYIGIVYTYLPFMVLPIYASLIAADRSLIEAARDLGCSRLSAFWRVTVPLSWPGVLAGCALVFIPAMGEFVIPDRLGGPNVNVIGRSIWVAFFDERNWPMAAAATVVLLALLLIPLGLYQLRRARSA